MTFLTETNGKKSVNNSSETPLTGGNSFTGTGEIVSGFSTVSIWCKSDQDSAVRGLKIQYSSDNTNWVTYSEMTGRANIQLSFSDEIKDKYFRIIYQNGDTLQTSFKLSVLYFVAKTPMPIRPEDLAQTDFSENTFARKMIQFGINPVYGLSVLRDRTVEVGDGSVSSTPGEGKIILSTGATSGSSALLETRQNTSYVPGFSMETGIGIKLGSSTTSGSAYYRWGSYNSTDGMFFGVDSGGFHVGYLRGNDDSDNGVTKIYQSDFNVDSMDGNGNSKLTLDLTAPHIYHVDYTWYGYGTIFWYVFVPDSVNINKKVLLHAYTPDTDNSIENPNLPISVECDNGDQNTDYEMHVGGRHSSTFGEMTRTKRITSERNIGVTISDSTPTPIISFRAKDSPYDTVTTKVQGIDFINNGNQPLIVELYSNTTLTTGTTTYGTPTNTDANETSLESNTGATAFTGGTLIFSTLVDSAVAAKGSSTNAGFGSIRDLEIFVAADSNLTLTAQFTATPDVSTGSVIFRIEEEW